MRVTNSMLTGRALRDLQLNYADMARAQEKVSSGRRINRPSDDPSAARTAVRVRDSLNALEQHLRNIDTADRSTSLAETALAGGTDLVQRVRELALQAANGTLGPSELAAVRLEVQQLADGLVSLANSKSGDDYLFSGQETKTPAYASLGAAYGGDGAAVVARISPGVRVQLNVAGDVAWGPALAATSQLLADLGAGNRPSVATIQAIEAGFDGLLGARATIGAVQNRLDDTRTFLESSIVTATKLLSDLEDADMAEVIATYASRQATYEAALAVNARILRRSLVDEL
jgi:flagellar hook-associated protein 3 FlgL